MSDSNAHFASKQSAQPNAGGATAHPTPRIDRWAHRRSEPRPFALLWILFMLASTSATIGVLGMLGLQAPDVYRPAVRHFLSLLGAGVLLLWPMIRLSQSIPRAPLSATLQDAFVVLIPLQAAVWPQSWRWMAGWPIDVVSVLAMIMGGWVLLTAALLSRAFRDLASVEAAPANAVRHPRASARRASWMGTFVLLASAGPCVSYVLALALPAGHPGIGYALLASPASAPLEVARDRSWTGHPAAAAPAHWLAASLTLGIGVVGLLIIGRHARGTDARRID